MLQFYTNIVNEQAAAGLWCSASALWWKQTQLQQQWQLIEQYCLSLHINPN